MGMDPVTMGLMAAGTGMSMLGSIQEGQQAKTWGKYQNKQAKADAAAQRGAAIVEAGKIRDAAKQQRSQAVAATAANGVEVGQGTAADIESNIINRAEQDAQMTIYNAEDIAKRYLAEGQAAEIKGRNAEYGSYMKGFGSLLGLGAGIAGAAAAQPQKISPAGKGGWVANVIPRINAGGK